jgi:hypothetical protein
MIRIGKTLLVGCFICLVHTVFAQQIKLSAGIEQALSKVDTAQFKADIAYLADDKLKGRGPGTEGYQMAVDYVLKRLKSLGVKPAGENNNWLQEVKLRKATTGAISISISGQTNAEPLKPWVDYAILPNPSKPDVSLSAPLAFAGYGTSEPSLNYELT